MYDGLEKLVAKHVVALGMNKYGSVDSMLQDKVTKVIKGSIKDVAKQAILPAAILGAVGLGVGLFIKRKTRKPKELDGDTLYIDKKLFKGDKVIKLKLR